MFATDRDDMKPDKYTQQTRAYRGPKLEIFADFFLHKSKLVRADDVRN